MISMLKFLAATFLVSLSFLVFSSLSAQVTGSVIPADGSAFVAGFDDLPLMKGLTQVSEDTVLFDTPQGRIVQASANGNLKEADVFTFYNTTLPQLGWSRVSKALFLREGEKLSLEIEPALDGVNVKFFISPR